MNIIIDSREQCPWSFDPSIATSKVKGLKTGDYAIEGDEDNFAIERKSLDDLLGTISTGWERFLREIGRMDRFIAKVIIVEGDFIQTCFTTSDDGSIIVPSHNHHKLTPQFIIKRIAQLTLMGVTVLFAANPVLASGLATIIFKERIIHIEEESC